MRKEKGFSLIELLIVVAIILVIAAIAIPSYLHSVRAAQEASMSSSSRTLFTSVRLYQTAFPLGAAAAAPADFSTVTLANLGNGGTPGACNSNPNPTATAACLIPDDLSAGVKGPYGVSLTKAFSMDGNTWEMTATPTAAGSPLKSYRVSQVGAILYSIDGGNTWVQQ